MTKTILFFLAAYFPCTLLHAQTPDTAWTMSVWHRVETTLYAGDFEQGEKITLAALDSARTRYGAESLESAELLDILGILQQSTNRYETFAQSAQKCLDIWKKAYGNHHEKVAHGLSQLGLAHFRLGQYDDVEPLLTQAIQMLADLGQDPSEEMATACSNLASYYEVQGYYLKAEPLHRKALRIETDMFGDQRFQYSTYANNLAVFYSIIKRTDEALYYYDACIRNMELYVGKDHPDYILTLKNKGMVFVDAGRYREAETLLTETLAAARKSIPAGDAELSNYLIGLGHLYNLTGQYEQSIRLEEESTQLLKNQYGESNPRYIKGLLKLGILNSEYGRLGTADSLLHQVTGILKANQRDQTLEYAQTLVQLGKNYLRERRAGEARSTLEAAAVIGEKIFGKDQPSYHWTFGLPLARLNLAENHPAEALRLLDAARGPILDSYGSGHEKFITLETLYGYAWQLQGDAQQALRHFRASSDALQAILSENFSFLSIDERENFARSFEGQQVAFQAFARSFPQDPSVQSFLYDQMLFQKELLASYDRQLLNDWQQNPDSAFQAYIETRRMIARQWTLPVKERLDLPELEARKTALEKTLATQSAGTAVPAAIHLTHWQQVQQALQPGDAALEWLNLPSEREWTGASCYAALLLRPGQRPPELILLPAVSRVDSLYALQGTRGLQYATRTYTGEALYQALWQPLESHLAGVRRIFYAPTGALHLLNFEAIQTPGGGLLSEKYQLVRVTNTARLLDPGFGKTLSNVHTALLAGGLNYETAAAPTAPEHATIASRGQTWRGGSGTMVRDWAALPNTRPEIEYLGNLLQQKNVQATLLTGADGSEAAVKARCSGATSPEILHFATHGFFFAKNTAASGSLGLVTAENPMFRSGLILAGANPAWRGDAQMPGNTAEDNILTADEISLLPLRNTALVVLSACETGLGDVRDDEGVYGLQRAFRLAGAQNIVMSLWRVPDEQTRLFMEKFYAALVGNGDARAAFQTARQALRAAFPNPYYWAGFVLLE